MCCGTVACLKKTKASVCLLSSCLERKRGTIVDYFQFMMSIPGFHKFSSSPCSSCSHLAVSQLENSHWMSFCFFVCPVSAGSYGGVFWPLVDTTAVASSVLFAALLHPLSESFSNLCSRLVCLLSDGEFSLCQSVPWPIRTSCSAVWEVQVV